MAYASVLGLIFLAGLAGSRLPVTTWPFLALSIGLALALTVNFLCNFIHEAAHHLLTPGRISNDRLSNLLLNWLIGMRIERYRAIHFDHHRHLGTPHDPENDYIRPLDLTALVRPLLGGRTIGALLGRNTPSERCDPGETPDGNEPTSAAETNPPAARDLFLLRSALIHLVLIGLLVDAGLFLPALTWVVCFSSLLPTISTIRNVLEHRDLSARRDTDYSQVDHGAFSRNFGSDLFARILGSGGFNRHLIHHWEPQISCTRLAELEEFLARTEIAEILVERTTTYPRLFLRMLRS